MQHNLLVMVSGLIFLLVPWYYTDSGMPQPVDLAILMLLYSFFIMRFPNLLAYIKHSHLFKSFLVFSVYATIALLVNYIIYTREISLFLSIQNIYFVFLVIAFLCMFNYFKQVYNFNDYYKLILIFLVIDSIIPLLYVFKTGIAQQRIPLSFNNENQLGFFALVNFSIFFYMTLMVKAKGILINKLHALFIINVNLLFLFLSASRACYPSLIMYALSYPLIFNMKAHGYSRILLITIVSGLVAVLTGFVGYRLFSHMMYARLSMMPTDYAGLYADFYLRALNGIEYNLNNIWYFLFGNGTYKNEARGSLEFHNNFLATFNIVGTIGLLLYSYMNIVLFKELLKKGFYYLVPFLCYIFYSMLHYSYRTRVNWILLAVMIFIAMEPTLRLVSATAKGRKNA